jgi:hypoxanthine phosphoribosyltransferase
LPKPWTRRPSQGYRQNRDNPKIRVYWQTTQESAREESSMKTLLTEDQLREGIRRLADEIQKQYQGKPLTIVGVLIGSVVLLADLIRLLDLPLCVEMVQARSYRGNSTKPGPLAVNLELLSTGIQSRNVLLVDDIFDTGHTLWELIPQIDELGPSSVRSAVLLQKEGRCEVPMKPDFVAFKIPNEFVVGYGLDYNDHYRNLPYLAVLEPNEIADQQGQ